MKLIKWMKLNNKLLKKTNSQERLKIRIIMKIITLLKQKKFQL